MRIIKINKVYVSNYSYNYNNSLKIVFHTSQYRPYARNISSEKLLSDTKKLGRKIFNILVDNNINILPNEHHLALIRFKPEVFQNYNLYKNELDVYIKEYGFSSISSLQLEELDMNLGVDTEYTICINELIESSILIFILETLKNMTDKNEFKKIYNIFYTNDLGIISHKISSLLFHYANNARINNEVEFSFQNNDKILSLTCIHSVTNIVEEIWNTYFHLIESNNFSINTCCYCGNIITNQEDNYIKMHKECLEKCRNKLLQELDNKRKNNKISEKDYKSKYNDYLKYDFEVVNRYKKRLSDKKYNDKRYKKE